jgi:pimeloyl-ACP methyl ester carboxylesterase
VTSPRPFLALLLTSTLMLSGCSWMEGDEIKTELTPSAIPDGEPAETPAALAAYYEQQLEWRSCRSGDQCTTVLVPLDYDEPRGPTVELSVIKVAAANTSNRVGTLVVNPGGPGGSGVDYAANASTYFGDEILAVFDVVGFDPRGVGDSDPVQCLSDARLDAMIASDPDPETTAERKYVDRLITEFGKGCVKSSGDLARHVSTVEAARDMDILRSALGESRLNFFGASYGTFLGATYADLFPTNVGRMVLDGAIDPTTSTVDQSLVQAEGFETALTAYVQDCIDEGKCFLGDTQADAKGRIQEFLADVDANPIKGDGERDLEIGNAVLGIWLPLYNEDYWTYLTDGLEAAFKGDGSFLLGLSDAYVGRGPSGYIDNSVEALYSVNCLDHDDATKPKDVKALEQQFLGVSPTFGRIFAYGTSACGAWPIHTGNGPHELNAEGAAPILVVGTTRDPATPLAWAQALAEQLESGVLITRDGDGHTGYGAGNNCVDGAVEVYLVSGQVPHKDLLC